MIIFLTGCIAVFLALAAYTFLRVRQITSQNKPDGSFATVNGLRLHYHFCPADEGRPQSPVLVFLHGASGNAYDSRLAFLKPLQGRFPLLFVDRPGHGFSERSGPEQSSPEEQAQLIAGLLEALEIKTAAVIGHSLGGAVAAALGLAAPERVKGLAFLAPVSHPWPGGVTWYHRVAALPVIGNLFCWTLTLPIAEKLAPGAIVSVFHPDAPPADYAAEIRLPLLFRPQAFRANSTDIAVLKRSVTRQAEHYSRLAQPALVVTGTQDTVVWPSIHCEGLLTALPDAELLILDQAGHMPHHTHAGDIIAGLERLVLRMAACEKNEVATGGARQHLAPV